MKVDNGKLSKTEIEYLLRALRTNVKAAKTAILGIEPKLRAEFEEQLNTFYPCRQDPVWEEAFTAFVKQYEVSQARVEARCAELGIPTRFRPRIRQPFWEIGGLNTIKELRAELRRVAYAQIKIMVQERLEQQDREHANVQLEILAHGCLTEVAKAFFDRLPTVESMIKPITAYEAFRLMEGHAHPNQRGYISYRDRKSLPEYLPDIGKEGEAD